jgi:hypothetical protein
MAKQQRYISNELTHFLGRSLPDDDRRYELLINVLRSGMLMHPPFEPHAVQSGLYMDKDSPFTTNEMVFTDCVCFCDIPVEDLQIHMAKYGTFGLAFSKSFLLHRGANPLFYIAIDPATHYEMSDDPYVDTPYADWSFYKHADPLLWERRLRRLIAVLEESARRGVPDAFEAKNFLYYRLLSYIKAFDINRQDSDLENFYMEREWRCIGNVKFALGDVQRVILPEGFAKRFRSDVPDYYQQVTFVD